MYAAFSSAENPLRQRDCRRYASGIFIDVERMVKMRDPQAFQIELGIEHEIFTEICLQQFVILGFKYIEGKRTSVFFDGVDGALELGKHGLAKECSPKIVDLTVDNIGAHLRIVRLFQQIMSEQFLVERRSDLGKEDRIIVIL